MRIPTSAVEQYERQQQIAGRTAISLRRLVSLMGDDFDAGWIRVRDRAFATVQLGRAASIHAAMPYTSELLSETAQDSVPAGAIVPATFLQQTPAGGSVIEALDVVPVRAKQSVASGASTRAARNSAASWLSGVVLTMLADTRRDVYQADIISRPQVTGYVRMLNPPSCSRCAILAGRRYLWNEGFLRHPNCDCQHIPASEQVAGDLRTDPYEYFKSLSEKEQNRYFGKYEAQGIRDGADIFQVVNTRERGLRIVGADGQNTGLVRYAGRTKPTLAQIYRTDPDRRFVIENLQYHGYITGPQNPMGNIRGNDPAARILAAGRGQGTVTVGGQTVTTARAARYDALTTGTRDLLNRSTMTAAERRLFDASYRARWAEAGYKPNSIGANSADRGLGLRPITPQEASDAYNTLQQQVARATQVDVNGKYVEPDSVRDLARLLGLI